MARQIFLKRAVWFAHLVFDKKAGVFEYSVRLDDPDGLCDLPFNFIPVFSGKIAETTQVERDRARTFARRLADTMTFDVR